MKLLWQDKVLILTFFIFLAVRFMTLYYISHAAGWQSSEDISKAAQTLEANPIAALSFQLGNFGMIITNIIEPALIVVLYLFYRRAVLRMENRELALNNLTFFAMFFFLASLGNFANDAAILLGKITAGV